MRNSRVSSQIQGCFQIPLNWKEGRPKEKSFMFPILQVFPFNKLEVNPHWLNSLCSWIKENFQGKVVFQVDLFPSIAITTSTTRTTILEHWLQSYGIWETALVISQYLRTQSILQKKKKKGKKSIVRIYKRH